MASRLRFGGLCMESLMEPLLKAVMPMATEHNVARFAPELATTMTHYSITGLLRTAHFLAQVAHESGQLAFTEELASGAAYEGRADLGNVHPGDGIRFKGRGLIQITGRGNYQAYSHSCGQDLLSGSNPARVATNTALAAGVAGWFWQVHGLNVLADADDVVHITRRINGGLNGLAQRQAFLALAKAALQRMEEHTAAVASSPATATTVVKTLSAVATLCRTQVTFARARNSRQLAVAAAKGTTNGPNGTDAGVSAGRQYRNAA